MAIRAVRVERGGQVRVDGRVVEQRDKVGAVLQEATGTRLPLDVKTVLTPPCILNIHIY